MPEKYNDLIKKINNIRQKTQYTETIYTYKIWYFTLYTYGEATQYTFTKNKYNNEDTISMRIRKTTHIIRDTYDIGKNYVPKKSTRYISI